jgi:DNA transformation protein
MVPDPFVDFLLDQLDRVPDVRAQRMFAGFGLYSSDLFFGIVYDGILYFKVDDVSRRDYVRAGMTPFKPYKDRPMTMQYFQVPASVVEDAAELCRWAKRAIAAAEKKRVTKATSRKKRRRAGNR